ncbi:MAG: biopolymer transporter ExbD [Myxococcales bacterium]|nr:biopolymer transporter ExbD [Myxococcota bacterium]MDW8283724.1 biopolymer transporter ExbD [Myxococcales bacterium]
MAVEVDNREAKRALKHLAAKIEEELSEINFLNIMPMLDMMTILLVFLLKQFSVQQLQLHTPAGLQLPASTTPLSPQPAVNITITQGAVVIEGDPVVTVRQGAVDPAAKKEGANSYHIVPVVDTLTKHATRLKKLAAMQGGRFDGVALVMVDKRTPYRLLTEVLYSAGQAEFSNYRLVVLQKGQ